MNQNVKLDKEKESATATIHALSHDGRGIATVNCKTTFVSGALPGETVTFKIKQKRSSYHDAEMLEVITGTSERVTPPCIHFGICGGCNLQHMSIASQLQLKQQTLLDQLKHFGKVVPETIIPPLQAQSTGYRRKARLGVKYVIKKNKLLVGFREKSSNYLAELESCTVLHPLVGQRLSELSSVIASLEQYRSIPQVEVAIGDHDAALVFRHLEPLADSDKDKLIQFGHEYHFHIYLQPNPPAPISKLWPHDELDRLTYTLPDYGLEFLFHPLDFTQINLEMNRLMVKQAIQMLDLQTEDTVLDLFCGIGNFTLPIARHAKLVTGIEGGADMVERAGQNARFNAINNAVFHAANLMEPASHAPWMNGIYNKILLDPPRAGAKEILPYFNRFTAKKIVYVSCNPATLARDAGELVHQYGYQLQQAGIMNMFPHTAHIEAMAVFEKM
jgi:23S rRNA (uracil1939-C5)-methyltransferase